MSLYLRYAVEWAMVGRNKRAERTHPKAIASVCVVRTGAMHILAKNPLASGAVGTIGAGSVLRFFDFLCHVRFVKREEREWLGG
ncbi:hypothetical protein ZHAS_00020061 [Anopheles sinensis]|uniref:Uncharacterized protein n=1 Tax=Anopheles sinensis TaxID=74873 RepID=A0A084WNV6_ANOSI|nr:hypothetical protein ZHAS_00020061 [Anopheles sinensis]